MGRIASLAKLVTPANLLRRSASARQTYGHSRKRRVFRQSLRLESLERRELFASDVVAAPVGNLDSYAYYKSTLITPGTDKFVTASTEADFDAKLKNLVQLHWADVLGKQPNEVPGFDFWNGTPRYFSDVGVQDNLAVVAADGLGVTSVGITRHESVDEGDAVDMTSDGYLYTVSGSAVHVANLSDPANISAKKLFALEAYNGQLIVSGNSLIVVQQANSGNVTTEFVPNTSNTDHTSITLYDISDRENPRAVSTTLVDGTNYGVRFSKGMLTLVNNVNNFLPQPALITDSSGIQRYESVDSYFAANRDAIVASLLPDYGQSTNGEKPSAFVDSGTWDDLSFANDALNRSTSVLRFQLGTDSLTLTDVETITGGFPSLVYQGLEDVYLVSGGAWGAFNDLSYIYKVDASDGGQLKTLGVAAVKGRVSDTSWMNEHNGILQVASSENVQTPIVDPALVQVFPIEMVAIDSGETDSRRFVSPWWGAAPRFSSAANITTIGDTADGWKVLGTLEDVGDGQSLLAASFVGDQAVVTTGTPQFFDPLHGIDLSDPVHPKELSELTIPGFTTYLMQIDATHWLGFGYTQDEVERGQLVQVSLYEGADLSDPTLVDTWTMKNSTSGRSWDPHAISYDPATGLLVMSEAQQWNYGGISRLPILKVDVGAEDPLHELGAVPLRDYGNRSFTVGNVLVVSTAHNITTYDVENLSKLSRAYLANYDTLTTAYWTVQSGETRDWRLAEQWTGEPFVITGIETSGDIIATLQPDQITIQLSAPAFPQGFQQSADVTVRFESGATHTVKVTLIAGDGYSIVDPPVYTPIFSAGRASIGAQFTDDAGNVVTELSAGDEVWVTVSITDLRDNPIGVFGGYVDVAFESQNVTVIGQLEYLDFDNGRLGSVSSSGVKSFGGFSDGQLPDSATSQLGRFKIRVDNDQPVSINITASTKRNEEILVHQDNNRYDPANVEPAHLTTQTETLRTLVTADNREQDVNSDGQITALDVLQVVNYINSTNVAAAEAVSTLAASQAAPTRYDLTRDGVVSGLDVLQIVNTINARYSSPASGEGSSLDAAVVDQIMAVDLDTLVRKK